MDTTQLTMFDKSDEEPLDDWTLHLLQGKFGVSPAYLRDLLPEIARERGETLAETVARLRKLDADEAERRREEWHARYG